MRRHQWGCGTILALWLLIGLVILYWYAAVPLLVVGCTVALVVLRCRKRARLHALSSVAQLYCLNPERFEQFVAEILTANGWSQVRWIGRSGDQGVDVVGLDPAGRKTVVQCKRIHPAALVGSPVVQRLIGSVSIYQADRGVIVTTGRFSGPAMQLAYGMDVGMIDGAGLAMIARGVEVV